MIELAIAAISGGLFSSFLTFFINKKKESRNDYTEIIAQWQKDNDRLRNENKEIRKKRNVLADRVTELEKDMISLNNKYQIMESNYISKLKKLN